jgi:hypothetical protein
VISTADNPHFLVEGGSFSCSNMVVSSFKRTNLRILKSNQNSKINCQQLTFKDIMISKTTGYHFNLVGEANLTNSVCCIEYIGSKVLF